jgi:hypothetical protein
MQTLFLANSQQMTKAARAGKETRLGQLLVEHKGEPEAICGALFVATLARPAAAGECAMARKVIDRPGARRQGWEDLQWALLNTTEFQFNH